MLAFHLPTTVDKEPFIVGAFLATALVLVLEVLDDRVKRPQDIEEGLGMTLLGVVPQAAKLK